MRSDRTGRVVAVELLVVAPVDRRDVFRVSSTQHQQRAARTVHHEPADLRRPTSHDIAWHAFETEIGRSPPHGRMQRVGERPTCRPGSGLADDADGERSAAGTLALEAAGHHRERVGHHMQRIEQPWSTRRPHGPSPHRRQ